MNAHQRRLKERAKLRFDWNALRKIGRKFRNVKLIAEIPNRQHVVFTDLHWSPAESEQMKSRLFRDHDNVLEGENLIRESVDAKVDALPLHDYQQQAIDHIKNLIPERRPVFVIGDAPGMASLMAHRRLCDPNRFLDSPMIILPSREAQPEDKVEMRVLKARGSKMPERFDVNLDFTKMTFNEPEKEDDNSN